MITSAVEINSLCCFYTHTFKGSLKIWLSSKWKGMLYMPSWFCTNKATIYSTQLNSYLTALISFKSLWHIKFALLSISSLAVHRNYPGGLSFTLQDSDGIGLGCSLGIQACSSSCGLPTVQCRMRDAVGDACTALLLLPLCLVMRKEKGNQLSRRMQRFPRQELI